MASVELKALADLLEEATLRQKFRRIEFFEPYPKQLQFFSLGLGKKERLLVAGNQLGKSEAGAFETAVHLTGLYPVWWTGRRWDRPVRAWAVGETSVVVRDVQQKKLFGEAGVRDAFGTGMVPKDCILDTSLARGVTDAYDTVQVQHYDAKGNKDGTSTLTFKSYEQGRTKMQGEPVDFIWEDEEPPEDIHSELLTRTTATKGMVFCTFTPLKGRSAVVIRFFDEPSDERGMVTMTIYDALHFTDEERKATINRYPKHERDARAMGVPIMGSGRIFQFSDEAVSEEPLEFVPAYWTKLWSIDFGIGHPFAAVLMLWDRENDILHVHHAIRVRDQLPMQHAVPMLHSGASVPVAWPQDGTAREKGTGETLASQYKKQKLLMLPEHATWPDGGNSTEAGVLEMEERFQTGRLKIARHLSDVFEEFRIYHRKDGQIVKVNDDLMSAIRVGVMAKRHGRAVALGGTGSVRRRQPIADGMDFDVFG